MSTKTPPSSSEKELDSLVMWVGYSPYLVAFVFFVLMEAYILAFVTNGWSKSPESWGQFGDYVGGVLNPLVAVLALVAISTSVRLQRKELQETRSELKASKEAAQEQAKTAEQQRREQRFFDFLNLYQHTLTTVDANDKFGKTAFRHWASEHAKQHWFIHEFLTHGYGPFTQRRPPPRQIGEMVRRVGEPMQFDRTAMEEHWAYFSPVLDHYFRTVFAILREAKPTLGEEHYRYVKLFRAQLSRDELALLTLNLMYDEEGARMRDLVTEYGLLKHLPQGKARDIAQKELNPLSFGRKWAEAQAK